MHKLAVLRLLKESLSFVEAQRVQALAMGGDATFVDREAGVEALTLVVSSLDELDISASPLRPILAAFQITDSPLFVAPKIAGGQSGSPGEDHSRGRLAGVVHLRSLLADGCGTRQAADWVASHLPPRLHTFLSPNAAQSKLLKGRTIYAWYERWGGRNPADQGHGRDGYLRIVEFSRFRPSEEQLKLILRCISNSPVVQTAREGKRRTPSMPVDEKSDEAVLPRKRRTTRGNS
jgi:hypothetical protein